MATPSSFPPASAPPLGLEHGYARLPEAFYARVAPTPVEAPGRIRVNRPLARALGLDPEWLEEPVGVEVLAGSRVPADAEPLAMAYAGHQFGGFVPSLGDGRAVLLGELRDSEGAARDVHLKGAGRTPFSRGGDGRAGLGPVLREYVVSEAMAGLGIPTTRALAAVTTGEPVPRPQRVEPGAVLTRVSASLVRVGTFQYFAARGDTAALRTLADFAIARLFPGLWETPSPYRALLDEAVRRQAGLLARWMGVGFVHGVMTTDNVSLAGETLDFGHCAFLDAYDPGQVYSSIDHGGRYAYDRQPAVAHWNLARFAETLLPLLAEDPEQAVRAANEVLETFPDRYEDAFLQEMRRKLGLAEAREDDGALARDLLACMAAQQADFTLTFRELPELLASDAAAEARIRARFPDPEPFAAWAQRWRARTAGERRDEAACRRAMRAANPAFIPRNHRVEQAIDAAVEGDLRPLDELLAVVTDPFQDHPDRSELGRPPEPHEVVQRTFCGT